MESVSLTGIAAIFVGATVVIASAGFRLAQVADRLADRTGMGEAIAGAVFLGGATSLPGLMTTTLTAWQGLPTLAVSNAIGGIAVQTLWLVIGDFLLRHTNLEHAAASPENMLQGGLLVTLLALPLLAMSAPPIVLWGVHPVSIALFVVWVLGMRMVRIVRQSPMWQPKATVDTVSDEPAPSHQRMSLPRLWLEFSALALVLGLSGLALAATGSALTGRTFLSESVMGGVFTAAASSLPELVVVIAAVRVGAYTMAVSNIIGGNALDTLFLLFADLAYREGSIYHAVLRSQQFFLVLTIMMTGVLLMGLVRRQREGWWRIGFESVFILGAYVSAILALAFMR